MAKLITLTDEYIEQLKAEFNEEVSKLRASDGKFTFTKTFSVISAKAKIIFTETAWYKMMGLIDACDKEIGWHGIAERYTPESPQPGEYYYKISDILVYPQVVTSATVTTDQDEYQMWLMSHDDEVFNNIRMQGHSHVNMGVTPSSVDLALYQGILDQLDGDMFYIFMIYNKKGEKTIKVYDLKENILFETSDCQVIITQDDLGIEKFISDSLKLCKEHKVVPVQNPSTYSSYNKFTPSQSLGYSYYDSNYGLYDDEFDSFWSSFGKKCGSGSVTEKKTEEKTSAKSKKTTKKLGKRKGFK